MMTWWRVPRWKKLTMVMKERHLDHLYQQAKELQRNMHKNMTRDKVSSEFYSMDVTNGYVFKESDL